MPKGGGGGGGSNQAAEMERARLERVNQANQAIDAAFAPFNDDFYGRYRQSILDFQMPQYQRQEAEAKKKAQYAIYGTGQQSGSAGAEAQRRLAEEFSLQMQNLMSGADRSVQELRSRIAARDAQLRQIATAGNDPGGVAAAAQRAAAELQSAPPPTALGQLFANLPSILGIVEQSSPTAGRGAAGPQAPGLGGTGSARVVQ